MRKDGYDRKMTRLLRREGFFKDRRSYIGHTVEDMEPHFHLEGDDRKRLREWLFNQGIRCQLKLEGCSLLAEEMDHVGEAADGTRFDERKHVRRACKSCHDRRHNRMVKSGKADAEAQ